MDLALPVEEVPRDFNEALFHDDHDHKSSRAFRTISEVSEDIDVPQHVLRFWESKFSQIRPLKRGGGRRYYRPEDIELLRRIKNYLYKQGYTIKGVQRLLKEKREAAVASFVPYASPAASMPGYTIPSAAPFSAKPFLQAAAAAPSAMAMAYGSIGSQIGEQFGNKEHFNDAFEQVTLKLEEEQSQATDQMEKSLLAVTRLHEEIASTIQPIRITNPSAPTLDDMPLDILFEGNAEPVENTVLQNAAPQRDALEEILDDTDFNQDVVDEDLPVKLLDAEPVIKETIREIEVIREVEVIKEVIVKEKVFYPQEVIVKEKVFYPQEVIVKEKVFYPQEVIVKQEIIVKEPVFIDRMPDHKKQAMSELLAEMVSLRDMLQAGITA